MERGEIMLSRHNSSWKTTQQPMRMDEIRRDFQYKKPPGNASQFRLKRRFCFNLKMKVLLVLFACILVVSAQWSSEQRERELERERERELKRWDKKWDDKKWDEKRWDKKSWVSLNNLKFKSAIHFIKKNTINSFLQKKWIASLCPRL